MAQPGALSALRADQASDSCIPLRIPPHHQQGMAGPLQSQRNSEAHFRRRARYAHTL